MTETPQSFRLYVYGDMQWTEDIIAQVKQAGYAALVLTVDGRMLASSPRSPLQGPYLSGIVRQSLCLSIIGALVLARVRVVLVCQHDGRRSAIASGRTVEEETMRFGLFGSAQAKRGGPDVDSGAGYRDFIDYNVEAEALGFHSTFLVEHHFTGFGQVSATLNLLTWIAARTTTLRLGTAVLVLPWHNPVLLAEQAATLDLLSGGRFDFGVGKGYRYNEFAGFCVPMEDAEARFDECLEVMIKAWTSDTPWSHRGQYWQFENVVVEPPTAQKPHPPLWMGAGSPGSIKKVAAHGYNLLLGQFASLAQIAEQIALFKSEVEACGRTFDPMSVGVTRSLNIVRTAADYEKAIETRMAARRRTQQLARRRDFSDKREDAEAGTLYGTPDEVATKLQALHDVGAEYVLLNSAGGPASLRSFAQEVMPAFADAPRG